MLDDQQYQGKLADQPIAAGTPVFDAHGEKIGEVTDRGMQRNALIVHKGIVFSKELYIPVSAIHGRDADGVHLSITKDEIGSSNWETPPTEAETMRSSSGPVDERGPVSGYENAGRYDTIHRGEPPRGASNLMP